jgi:uncharacterized membrane protein YfcA
MDIMQMGIVILAGFVASFVSTLTGFGAAAIMTPFMIFALPVADSSKIAIILVAFFHGATNMSKVALMIKKINWPMIGVFGIPSILAAWLGAEVFTVIRDIWVRMIFAVFLIAFSTYSYFNPKIRIPQKRWCYVTGGVISGLVAGLIGPGGPIRSMFLISTLLVKETYISTAAGIAVMNDIARISVYLYKGVLPWEYMWLVIPLVALAFLGAWTGRRVLRILKETVMRRIVMAGLFLIGCWWIVDAIVQG